MKNIKKPVLVLGGTGNYGKSIVQGLKEIKQTVRVLSRNPENAQLKLGKDVEIVKGDITNEESIKQSLIGVKAVIIAVSAFTPSLIKNIKAIEEDSIACVLDNMKIQNISRVVFISVFKLRLDIIKTLNIMPLTAHKLFIEEKLKTSSLNWTVLGAPPMMDLFFRMLRNRRLVIPGGGPPAFSSVAGIDLGRIAAQSVIRDDLSGKRFSITCQEPVSFTKAAELFSQITGKKISVFAPPLMGINIISLIVKPFNPYLRFLYYSLKMLNYFPKDEVENIPHYFEELQNTFDYNATSLEDVAKDFFF